MESKLALFCVLFTATFAVGLGISCENNDEFEGKCYFFSEYNMNWDEARIFCSNLDTPTVKYDLLIVDASTNKYNYIKNQLAMKGMTHAFVGAHDLGFNHNQWEWVDYTPLQLKNPLWALDHPYYSSYSECGMLDIIEEEAYPSNIHRLRLVSYRCINSQYFICEGKGVTTNEEIPETENIK